MSGENGIAVEFADSVGFVVDRCLSENDIIGSGFMVEEGKFATLATLVLPYGANFDALKIVFPRVGKEYSIESAYFHPHFNKRFTRQTVERTIVKAPELTVRKHNCAIISLSDNLKELSPDEVAKINDSLSLARTNWDKGLSGTLDEIDLTLVIQTISNARKHGQLVVSDVRNRPIAKLFFSDGKVFHAQFRHLRKENAIYQLVASKVQGFFEFRPSKDPEWPALNPMARPMDMLLLESFRRLDELEKLRSNVGGADSYLGRARGALDQNVLPPDAREKAISVWRLLDGLTPSGRIWELVRFDEYDVFQTLDLLQQTDQIKRVTVDGNLYPSQIDPTLRLVHKIRPLPLSTESGIILEEEVHAITLNMNNAFVAAKKGIVMGNVDDSDAWHLIHTAPVLVEGIGCPIIRNKEVVGMHCGILPASRKVESSIGLLQQMLWVGSIHECLLKSKTEMQSQSYVRLAAAVYVSEQQLDHESPDKLVLAAAEAQEQAANAQPPIATNVDDVQRTSYPPRGRSLPRMVKDESQLSTCPQCGSHDYNPAFPCPDCSYVPVKPVKQGSKAGFYLALLVLLLVATTGGGSMFWLTLPQPNVIAKDFAVLSDKPWLKLSVEKADTSKMVWQSQPSGTLFHNGETIYFEVKVNKSAYVYLLYRGRFENTARLIYPSPSEGEPMKSGGSVFTYPEETMQHTAQGNSLVGMTFAGPPGDETIVAIASTSPLHLDSQSSNLEDVFEKASGYLTDSESTGLEVSKSALLGNLANDTQTGKNLGTVYLTKLVAKHT
jgi:hypothetical protein